MSRKQDLERSESGERPRQEDCSTCAQKDGGGGGGIAGRTRPDQGWPAPGSYFFELVDGGLLPDLRIRGQDISFGMYRLRRGNLGGLQGYVSPHTRPEGCAQAGRSEGAGRVNLTLKTESSDMFLSTA